VAIVVGFILAVVLLIVALTGVAGIFILLAISSVVGFVAFHYFVWGWWLTKSLRDKENTDGTNGDSHM